MNDLPRIDRPPPLPPPLSYCTQAWFVFLIVLTQGPRILRYRLCWLVFGPGFHSGCATCGGSGKQLYYPVTDIATGESMFMGEQPIGELRQESGWYTKYKIGEPKEERCPMCNGFVG